MNLEYTHIHPPGDGAGSVTFIDTNPELLCIVTDGTTPILRIAGGGLRDYPVRDSFTDTLLRWHRLGAGVLRYASNETAVSLFNDLLLAIRGESVRVLLVDGEAAAISSPLYPARRRHRSQRSRCTS